MSPETRKQCLHRAPRMGASAECCFVCPLAGVLRTGWVRRSLSFREAMNFIGIDLGCSALTGSPGSAVAVLDDAGKLPEPPVHFSTAEELAELVSGYKRDDVIVAVDAPRSVPDHTKENYAYRSCEKGIKVIDQYAGAFSGAVALFIRWYEIERQYFQGIKVIETYPRVVWKRLDLPGKPKNFSKNRQEVWSALRRLLGFSCEGFSHHQVDAVLCAYTAWCHARGQVDWYGEPGEGLIIIPAPGKSNPVPAEAERIQEKFRRFPCMS